MKYFRKNLLYFAIILAIYSVVFRYLLSYSLENEMFYLTISVSVLYGVIIFFTAWFLGKADSLHSFIFDAGLGFHLTTYIVWGIVSELWFILGFGSKYEPIKIVHYTLLFWGIFLLIHIIVYFKLRKRTIKGVLKSEIFE